MRWEFARAAILGCTLLALASVSSVGHARTTDHTLVVATAEGNVRGSRKNGVRKFLGIPYAAPPVGSLRWRPPEAHAAWKTIFAATHMGASCPQFLPGPQTIDTAENCLFLNIYAPDSSQHDLPVMFWIHGGAFILGSGAMVDGSVLARKYKLIVVTINYRLGALGFLALPSLAAENRTHVSGNYGLLDQQAALRWVKRNISTFGGDPGRVTIVGESAGGIRVCAQLVSPAASGLFRGAIIESGPCLHQDTLTEGEKLGSELVAKLGCDQGGSELACLRSKSAEQVRSALPGSLEGPLLWAPVIDGHILPQQPADAFHSGTFNKMPLINGSNRDEGTLFIAFGRPLPAQNYEAAIGSFATPQLLGSTSSKLNGGGEKVSAEYPLSHYQSPSQGLTAVLGDAVFSCPIERTGQLLSGFVPTYEYEFNDRNAPATIIPHPPFLLGAYHAAEILYVFQTYFPAGRASSAPDFSPAQQQLADRIGEYWTTFIKTGHPDGGSPTWSPEKARDSKVLSLAPDGIGYESDFAAVHHCKFWNSLAQHRKP
jgi:para-nitrobenzyl esterase